MLTLLKFNLLRIITLMWFLFINCIEINHQNHGGRHWLSPGKKKNVWENFGNLGVFHDSCVLANETHPL